MGTMHSNTRSESCLFRFLASTGVGENPLADVVSVGTVGVTPAIARLYKETRLKVTAAAVVLDSLMVASVCTFWLAMQPMPQVYVV